MLWLSYRKLKVWQCPFNPSPATPVRSLVPKHKWHRLHPGKLDDDLTPPLGDLSSLGDAAVEAWDYAAALSANIPELAVFRQGFNEAGFAVWEAFDQQFHPGFAMLRFLGMSSQWGKCDRWLVGNAQISEDVKALVETCTAQEVQAILAYCRMAIAGSSLNTGCK